MCADSITSDDRTAPVLSPDGLPGDISASSLFASMPLGVYCYELQDDDRLVFVGANPAADRIQGVDHRQYYGMTLETAFPPLAATEVPARFRQVAREGIPWYTEQVEYQDAVISGAFEVIAFPFGTHRVAVLFRDITARKQEEAAKELLREHDRQMVEAIPMIAWHSAADGTLLDANSCWYAYTGQTREEALRDWTVALHPDDVAFAAVVGERASATGTYEAEYRLRRASDGEYRRHQAHAQPVRDAEGVIRGWFGVMVDIHEQKLQEERLEQRVRERTAALHESEARLRRVMDGSHDGYWEWDVEIDHMFLSSRLREILGFTEDVEYVSNTHFLPFIHTTDAPHMHKFMQGLVDGSAEQDYAEIEYRFRRPDGEIIWVITRASASRRDLDGRARIISGATTDITARRQAEGAVRESRAKLVAALESMIDSVVITDALGQFIDFNEAFARFLRFDSKAECIQHLADATDLFDITTLDGQAVPPRDWMIPRALRGERRSMAEYIVRRRDIDVTWTGSYSYAPIRDAWGAITGAVVVCRDITEMKQAEQERETLRTELAQAQKLETLGQLAGGVAHDFNNMLGVILAQSELALRDMAGEHPLREHLTEIQQAATRSAHLTRQLLAFARKQATAPRVLRLNDTLSGMLTMLQRLIGANITLSWHPGPDLWAVKMDPAQINQLLANLCVNARDAIGSVGTVTIETRNTVLDAAFCASHRECLPGEYVQLTIRDDGCGMDAETLTHLFEPFFTTKPVGQGTGLGLATCYGIVKQNGGCITVDSAPGRGSDFTLYLPRHIGPADADTSPEPLPAAPGRETVLVVEDEPAILRAVTLILKGHGYQVLGAASPIEALTLAEEHDGAFQLLLTDMTMPEMSGHELAERLRARHPALRCLLMSGFSADMLTRRGVPADGMQFIPKPFTIEQLTGKVREVLDLPE